MQIREIITEEIKWLRPGELRGSYTDQQLLKLGFRKASNGSWFISMPRWQSLVSAGKISEVSNTPATQLQEIEPIPASDFTGRRSFRPDSHKNVLRDLIPLRPPFYYRVKNYGIVEDIEIFHLDSHNIYTNVAILSVDIASWMPVPARQVNYIAVRKEYENMGLGKQLYKLYFKHLKTPLVTGDSQTPGGRRMWQKLWQDPEIDVVGLISIDDDDFDRWDNHPRFRQWIDNLMDIGGEYLGFKTFHWFRVPLRQMRRQMEILKHFKLYDEDDEDITFIAHMMATPRGSTQKPAGARLNEKNKTGSPDAPSNAKQILRYVKSIHHDFRLDHEILKHQSWQLSQLPLSQLHIPDPETGEEESDPYDRVQWMDMGHVDDITVRDINSRPIVVDSDGHILDGNHRALAARLRGMPTIPAWHPVDLGNSLAENFADHAGEPYSSSRGGYPLLLWTKGGQAVAEGKPITATTDTLGNAKKLWQYIRRNFTDLASNSKSDADRNELYIDERLDNLFTTANGQPVKVGFSMAGGIKFDNGVLIIPIGTMWRYREMYTASTFVTNVVQALSDQQAVSENFADGRNPQDKGDSRRHGIPKKATIAQLKKIRSSKTASPRKKQLAHWQINMRQGKKK